MLYEELLSTRRLDMDLLDECEQFLPSLFMGAAILSRVDGRQFPSLAAGKDTDRLPEFACGLVQGIRRSGPIDALPKIGTELAVRLFQACPFKNQVLEICRGREFVGAQQMAR